jgi:hypothetical protein
MPKELTATAAMEPLCVHMAMPTTGTHGRMNANTLASYGFPNPISRSDMGNRRLCHRRLFGNT